MRQFLQMFVFRTLRFAPITIGTAWSVLLIMLVVNSAAQADTRQIEEPRIFAITDIRIVTAPDRVIDNGTIVLRDGLIEAVGTDVKTPPDATVITGEKGWTVYPAFIDAASSVGLKSGPENGAPQRPGGTNEEPELGSPHKLKAVHPELAVVDQLDVGDSSVKRHRELGFAVANVLPAKGVFRGESAAILLREAPAHNLVLVDRLGQVIALETSSFMSQQYPSSTIGAVAAVRQTLLDAQRQQVWNERYAANPRGMPHPEYRSSDAPLLAILNREQPVIFVSLSSLDPGRFHNLATEFQLHAMTVATGLDHRFDNLHAADMPILLPLEMPEKPELDDADNVLETSLEDLQTVVRAPSLPAELAAADIEFAFVTAGMKSVRKFPENLAKVVDAGLSKDQALAAVTTVPARLLGLENSMGTLDPGKQANLLIVDGDLFVDKPVLRHLFVDGYHEKIKARETIGDPNAVVDPRGTWEITSSVMGRSAESTWTITGSSDAYSGSSESSRAGKRPFKSVELVGNALTVVSETPRGEIDMTVVITGESLSGETTMESPRGSVEMKIEGRRIAGPESSEL